MGMHVRRVALAFAAAVSLFGIVGVGGAQAQTSVVGPFTVNCTGSGQLCTPLFTTPVVTSGPLQVSYTASPGHCSTISVHFFVDGVELAATPFLAPGETSAVFSLGPVSSGAHTLGLQGEGQVNGCNTGSVANWGGTAQVTVGALAQAPIPAPGLLVTALAFAFGAFVYLRRRTMAQRG